eukprot:7401148-Pyramimonas_sp.AAC.1
MAQEGAVLGPSTEVTELLGAERDARHADLGPTLVLAETAVQVGLGLTATAASHRRHGPSPARESNEASHRARRVGNKTVGQKRPGTGRGLAVSTCSPVEQSILSQNGYGRRRKRRRRRRT